MGNKECEIQPMKTELLKQLEVLALKRSIPFCYSCYEEVKTGRCLKCGSDDLMRKVDGVGVEWGTAWVIEHLLQNDLAPIDLEEAFEESMRECYPETTTIGFLKDYDTVTAMKEFDPVSWNLAQSEWASIEEDDERIISVDHGATYYWISDIEGLLSQEALS